jgi:hypothetical protein
LCDPAGTLPPSLKATEQAQPRERLNLSGHSLCDAVSSGMTKDSVSKLAKNSSLRLAEKEQQSDGWVFEDQGFRCDILLDKAGGVMKKKKPSLPTKFDLALWLCSTCLGSSSGGFRSEAQPFGCLLSVSAHERVWKAAETRTCDDST